MKQYLFPILLVTLLGVVTPQAPRDPVDCGECFEADGSQFSRMSRTSDPLKFKCLNDKEFTICGSGTTSTAKFSCQEGTICNSETGNICGDPTAITNKKFICGSSCARDCSVGLVSVCAGIDSALFCGGGDEVIAKCRANEICHRGSCYPKTDRTPSCDEKSLTPDEICAGKESGSMHHNSPRDVYCSQHVVCFSRGDEIHGILAYCAPGEQFDEASGECTTASVPQCFTK